MNMSIDNPLVVFVNVAKINHEIWLKINSQNSTDSVEDINKDFISPISNSMKKSNDEKIGHKSIEQSAIAKYFEEIRESKNEVVVFENTLAYSLHGIDAITKDKNGIYTIYEIKGTTRALRSARSYLSKTKHKGRQLTLQWCWYSLVDFAELPPAANVFLELYEDFINQKVKRKLTIVECQKQDDKSYLGNELHTYSFDELNVVDDYDMSKQKRMLEDLKKDKYESK